MILMFTQVLLITSGAYIYYLAILCAKLALFSLYLRLFAVNSGAKIAIYVGIIVNCLMYLTAVVADRVLCTPRSGDSWTSIKFVARCRISSKWSPISGIYGLISDIYIILLPQPILWRLQMPMRRKWGISAIFLTSLM